MVENVTTGYVQPFWNTSYKKLNYVAQPISESEISTWVSQGYDYVKSFTGSMYSGVNPMPEWVYELEDMFDLYNQTYNFYRMNTLEIMPTHSDHYNTYMRLFNVPYEQVCRVVLMLEDWKPGHYFELDGVGYVNWKAGDWFKWKSDTPHAAANIGVDPRYTLQITGVSIYSGQFNDLFVYNVPDFPTRTENRHPMLTRRIIPRLGHPSSVPCMLYMDNTYIKKLDKIYHSKETSEKLNETGIHIHLYEPLCSYKKRKDSGINTKTMFYEEFKEIKPKELRAEELDSILNYATRNNLTNITVHTGDYQVKEWYPYYQPTLNLITDDLFLKSQVLTPDIEIYPLKEFNINKHFLCLNWRYTKHRNLAAAYLSQRSSYTSWYYNVPFDVLEKDLFFDLESWQQSYPDMYQTIKDGTDFIATHGPLCLDVFSEKSISVVGDTLESIWPNNTLYSPGQTPAIGNSASNNLQEYYNQIFVDVITETRFAQPTANFSEKVFQAMQYYRPFILLAPPNTLEYIKTFGFKTFSDFWDESYDKETNHGKRLAMIFKLIDQIEQYSLEDLKKIGTQMRGILTHNRKLYLHQTVQKKG